MTTTKELRADLEVRLKALREQLSEESSFGTISEQTRLALVRVDIGTVGIFRHIAELESALTLKTRALEMANEKLETHCARRSESVAHVARAITGMQTALGTLSDIQR